jgi:DNA primase
VSGRIPTSFIDQLVARTDIVEVIGARIALKRAGKEFKACCPFHGEKTPSFTVVPDKQFYHCFGCGAHGSALGFLMDYEHLGFVEAVEELAAKAGIEIPRDEAVHNQPKPEQSLYTVLERAGELYRKELKNSERAKSYLKQRGLTGETAVRFGIGYVPEAWDWLIQRLAPGASTEARQQLLQTGLIIAREQNPGHYDRFRDRIMFPIRDTRGRTIGFGGRILDKGEPKYLNSPETELFHKGRELYGLYEARQSTRSCTRLMVVEGYMDVVRLHQAGITYAVATLGTATTDEHLQRLFRVCNEVVFCFDGDRAGRAAAWRALENALPQVREGRQIRFLFLPDGEDPDSLVGREGREAFEARLLEAEPLSEYFVRHLSSQVDLRNVDGRAQLSALAQPLLVRIPPGVYRDLLIGELAKRVGIAEQRLTEIVNRSAPATYEKPAERVVPSRPLLRESNKPASGRPSLVRQAVHLLVHHPQAADSFRNVAALEPIQHAGIDLLMELLLELQARPCASTGALLERWRDRPHSGALAKLATVECLPDANAAAVLLNQTLEKLIQKEIPARRCDELLAKKASEAGLTPEERLELQTLLQNQPRTPRN